MLLAIDCGNTNTVFSIWDGTRFLATWRTSTEWQRTADQYYVWLSTLMQLQKIDVKITDVIVSSTVPRTSWSKWPRISRSSIRMTLPKGFVLSFSTVVVSSGLY